MVKFLQYPLLWHILIHPVPFPSCKTSEHTARRTTLVCSSQEISLTQNKEATSSWTTHNAHAFQRFLSLLCLFSPSNSPIHHNPCTMLLTLSSFPSSLLIMARELLCQIPIILLFFQDTEKLLIPERSSSYLLHNWLHCWLKFAVQACSMVFCGLFPT